LIDKRLGLLHKVIDQLSEPQQQALELAVFRGLSEEGIAAELVEPLGKVRTGLRAAVAFVRHRRRAILGTWAADI
jgi:DNA-directed RNA polymerase specialized sigma24 family protein